MKQFLQVTGFFQLLAILLLITDMSLIPGYFNDHTLWQATPAPSDNQSHYWEWAPVSPDDDFQLPAGFVEACDFLSADDGWAVGKDGFISHWDGTKWKPSSYHVPAFLNGIHAVTMIATDDVWAVGEGGLILHWDGKEWKDLSYSTDDDLLGVSFASASSGFAVGGPIMTDKKDPLVLHWDGKQWSEVPFLKPGVQEGLLPWLTAVQMVSEKNGWISGNGSLYRWNGIDWNVHTQENENETYITVDEFSMLDSDDIWAAGYLNNHDTILHWDGSTWNERYNSDAYMIVSIKMVSPSLGWAVGILPTGMRTDDSVNSVILSWDGTNWSEMLVPRETFDDKFSSLNQVCAFNQNHAWVFGNNQENLIALRYTEKTALDPSATPTLVPSVTIVSTPVSTPTNPGLETLVKTEFPPTSNGKVNQPDAFLWVGGSLLFVLLITLLIYLIRVQRN